MKIFADGSSTNAPMRCVPVRPVEASQRLPVKEPDAVPALAS
jgi:hypothetical protein